MSLPEPESAPHTLADWASWGMHGHDHDDYSTVVGGKVRWKTFRGCVVSVLQRLLDELGEAGYRAKWVEHDFPIEELRRLGA